MSGALDLDAVLEAARAIAAEAAALVLTGYRMRPRTSKKGAVDLVTEFDLASEKLICERLSARFPAHRIVGEEGGVTAPSLDGDASRASALAGDASRASALAWYVDPIDGTTNFAHGHPFFAVSIALCENDVPLVGVVDAPALGVVWSAARGRGATRNASPCAVSGVDALNDALCATGFPYSVRTSADNNFAEFFAVKLATHGIRRCGAAALDLAMVADGTYDAYWEQGLKPWDVAAGALLVQEAGGRISDYSNAPFKLHNGRVVASNARIHDELIDLVDDARRRAKIP